MRQRHVGDSPGRLSGVGIQGNCLSTSWTTPVPTLILLTFPRLASICRSVTIKTEVTWGVSQKQQYKYSFQFTGVEMEAKTGKFDVFHSHKLGDGSWCNGKGPKWQFHKLKLHAANW